MLHCHPVFDCFKLSGPLSRRICSLKLCQFFMIAIEKGFKYLLSIMFLTNKVIKFELSFLTVIIYNASRRKLPALKICK